MLHLTDCVRQLRHINSFTAYKFENFLQQVKRCVKKPNKILEQVEKKMSVYINNEETFTGEKTDRFGNIIKYTFNNFILTSKMPNNICCVQQNIPFKISKFERINDACFIVGHRFSNSGSFFDSPILSSSLGILLTDANWNSEEESFSISEISFKYVYIPFKNRVVLTPLLHTVN